MAQLLQNIILSDVTLFFIMGLMIVFISWWAISIREYAGYILGWMIGFLFMLLVSVFAVGQPQPDIDVVEAQVLIGPAVFIGLVVASVIGLIVGVVALTPAQVGSSGRSKVGRALTVAIATSFTLAAGYLMILTSFSFRLMIAAFVLAVAIGALFNFILMRQRARQTLVEETEPAPFPDAYEVKDNLAQPVEPSIPTYDLPSPLAQRVQNLRQRARRFGDRT